MTLLAWLFMVGWHSFPVRILEDQTSSPKPRVREDQATPPKSGVASAVLLSCLMLGCAGARDRNRVESLLFLPHQREIVLPIRSNEQPAAFIAATCDRGTRRATRCSH